MIVQCAACTIMDRAQGCLLGQLAGDSLGALVEFRTPEEIRSQYPQGVRLLADGGTWDTLAGQPTDDSEMALMLARTLLEKGEFNADAVLEAYRGWLDSEPFDRGTTISRAPSRDSPACGKPAPPGARWLLLRPAAGRWGSGTGCRR